MPARAQATDPHRAPSQKPPAFGAAGLLRTVWPAALPLAAGIAALLLPVVLRPEQVFAEAVGASLLLMAASALTALLRSPPSYPTRPARTDRTLFAIAVLALATLWLLYLAPSVSSFQLRADDHDYLNAAREQGPLLPYLFTPYNEHLCVGTRLLMLAFVKLDEPALRVAAAWWCRIAALVNFFLFASLLWRLTGTAAVLVPMCALFLVPIADEPLEWFSASQWLIGSAFALAACHLSLSDHPGAAVAAVLLVVLALLNFTVSLLGVLLCTALSLGLGRRRHAALIAAASAATLVPAMIAILPGTVRNADYGGQSFAQGVQPLRALFELARVAGDVATAYVPFLSRLVPLPPVLAGSIALGVAWIAWLVGRHRTGPTGTVSSAAVVLLAAGYAVPLTFRAWLPHRVLLDAGRYHWWPHLAFTLLVAALSLTLYRFLRSRTNERVSRWFLVALAAVYATALLASHCGGRWP